MKKHNALLEIGTEEIPARLAPGLHKNLRETAERVLKDYRINIEEIIVVGAPRRLALLLEGISEYQEKMVEEIKGPPENISYDEEGNPTGALKGFMRNKDLTEDQLDIRETDNGNYIFAVIDREKKQVRKLLPDVFYKIIEELPLPAAMRWGSRETEFIRPIHWLCALCDDQVVDFEYAGQRAAELSYGHRFLSPQKIEIQKPEDYMKLLKEHFVIVAPGERKRIIKEGIKKIEAEHQIKAQVEDDLLTEVVHLVEYPTPFLGSFAEKYLKLPEPVLVTPTREHQKYFPVFDQDDELYAGFIGVRDGSRKYLEQVIRGNEKVLKARFDDAEFYFEKDLQLTNRERIEELKNLVFREELGDMYSKVERIKEIAVSLGKKKGLDGGSIQAVGRAAELCKTDLVSKMVREFPELQGLMGAIYARKEKETETVCRAIKEHYRPEFAGDELPETVEGKILSLADKLDTLCGCFAVGLIPTGSEDPYGLRRAANGIVRLLNSLDINISVRELTQKTISGYQQLGFEENIFLEIDNFLKERIEYRLETNKNISSDLIKAGLKGNIQGLPQIMKLIEFLDEVSSKQAFSELVTVYNRIESIVDGFDGKNTINSELFLEKEEQNLYNIYWQVAQLAAKGEDYDFEELYQQLCELITPVHNFFEAVKIMVDNPQIRKNRLCLLQNILEELSKLGQLSAVVSD